MGVDPATTGGPAGTAYSRAQLPPDTRQGSRVPGHKRVSTCVSKLKLQVRPTATAGNLGVRTYMERKHHIPRDTSPREVRKYSSPMKIETQHSKDKMLQA